MVKGWVKDGKRMHKSRTIEFQMYRRPPVAQMQPPRGALELVMVELKTWTTLSVAARQEPLEVPTFPSMVVRITFSRASKGRGAKDGGK
jgi:hypothetical protein